MRHTSDVPRRLTVLYDAGCPFCVRCRDWLAAQPLNVEMELVPAGSPAARKRFGSFGADGEELCVVDESGRVWVGPDAFVLCLWATRRHRSTAHALSRAGLRRLGRACFSWLSDHRTTLGKLLEPPADVTSCAVGRCGAHG